MGDSAIAHCKNYSVKINPRWVTQVSGFTELVSSMKRIHKHITIHHPPHTFNSLQRATKSVGLTVLARTRTL